MLTSSWKAIPIINQLENNTTINEEVISMAGNQQNNAEQSNS